MKHFLLTYHLAPDYLERRPEFRAEHLALAQAAVARGELLLGGALDPADRAVLLFAAEDATAAERFAASDPYVIEGLVERWEVRTWTTVVGKGASMPITGRT
ncbi:YciI-like protein [Novosphingobium sp. JCM 18896]|uniref:YciI-like protein n=1 Tax=Novosphingobium sp. JCM 18896 TaxID=2989731 RepID=UPI002221D497|nr:YciI-like protein [Novosphingobium sp. JCM 18896]MCW1430335.1 YciI-like protein [Novosphingobium sp. JCM 18896]